MFDSRFVARRLVLTLGLLVGLAAPASAQMFELGGGISRGCTGDSSGFCSGDTGAMWSVHGGLWVTSRWQITVRLATLPLPDFTYTKWPNDRPLVGSEFSSRDLPHIDVTARRRSRQLAGGEALYYFAGARRVGAVLGFGVGNLRNQSTESCEPRGCEQELAASREPVGRSTSPPIGNVTFVAGLSGPAGKRVRISAGVRLHNFAGEQNATTEAFVAAGFRLGAF